MIEGSKRSEENQKNVAKVQLTIAFMGLIHGISIEEIDHTRKVLERLIREAGITPEHYEPRDLLRMLDKSGGARLIEACQMIRSFSLDLLLYGEEQKKSPKRRTGKVNDLKVSSLNNELTPLIQRMKLYQPTRIINYLEKNKIKTIGDLLTYSYESVKATKGVGDLVISTLSQIIEEQTGLSWEAVTDKEREVIKTLDS